MFKSNTMFPFGLGLMAGAAAVSILAFASGRAVTSQSSQKSVADARVNAQAQICAALASDHVNGTAIKEDLEGYQSDAREARDKLARKFAVVLPGETAAEGQVVTACAQLLNKPPR